MNFWGPWSTNLWSRLKMGKIRLFQPGKFVVNHDKWDIDHIKAWSTLGFGLPHFETWSLMNSSGTWLLFFNLRRTPLVCKTAHLQMLNLHIYIYIYIWFACTYVIHVYMYMYEHAIHGWKWTCFELAEGTNQVGLYLPGFEHLDPANQDSHPPPVHVPMVTPSEAGPQVVLSAFG